MSSTPLWRKKHNTEDKDKIISAKVPMSFEEKKEYQKYFKNTDSLPEIDSFKTQPSISTSSQSKPYIPEFLRNKVNELNPDLQDIRPLETEAKPITLTSKDFPSLLKTKKSRDGGPSPTETPNNTPNTFSYLEAAKKNADKPAPKPNVVSKTRVIESVEERDEYSEEYDSTNDPYGQASKGDWVDEYEYETYGGKWH